jgi:hypothetical protein
MSCRRIETHAAAATAGLRSDEPIRQVARARLSFIRLGLGLVLGVAAATLGAWPYGQPGQVPHQPPSPYGQPPPQQHAFQFRPQPPSNAQGTPPTYQPGVPAPGSPMAPPGYPPGYAPFQGQVPGQYPGQYPAPPQQTPPRLEATVDESEPYLQQPLLVRVQLITAENPGEANLELPQTGEALIQRLEGPTAESRDLGQGRREIVNSFILTLIPLRAGSLEIPPFKVTGTIRGYGGVLQRFEAKTDRPIGLQVRPAMTAVSPWLPLKSLTLKSKVDREETLLPGEPVTLALELAAVGGTSAQLPGLEGQLSGPQLRVYREQVLTEDGLTDDGRDLSARRTEYYTLVPQSTGRLILPEISVAWWNTELGTREIARLPMRTLHIGGANGPFGMPSSIMSDDGWVWLPLLGVLLVLAGYWGGVILGARPDRSGPHLGARLADQLLALRAFLGERWSAAARRLRPGPVIARARSATMAALPASSRFLMSVRHANQASEPVDWCERFEADARSRLRRFQGETTQPDLTKLILTLRPGADPATLTRLMQELDGTLYGGRQSLDFARWKRDFMRQVGRGAGLRRRASRVSRIKRAGLPALNPGH